MEFTKFMAFPHIWSSFATLTSPIGAIYVSNNSPRYRMTLGNAEPSLEMLWLRCRGSEMAPEVGVSVALTSDSVKIATVCSSLSNFESRLLEILGSSEICLDFDGALQYPWKVCWKFGFVMVVFDAFYYRKYSTLEHYCEAANSFSIQLEL